MGLIAFGLGFTACNTNDDDMPEIEKGEKARVSIRVAVNSQGTRIVGDVLDSELLALESAVNALEVWIFNATTGVLEAHKRVATTDAKVYEKDALQDDDPLQQFGNSLVLNDITVPAGDKQLVMAANTNIGGVVSSTRLSDFKKTLSAAASQEIDDGMVMTSLIKPITLEGGMQHMFGTPPAGHHHPTVPFTQLSPGGDPLFLSRINARVALAELTFEFKKFDDPDYPEYVGKTGVMLFDGSFVEFDRFVLTDVVVLNAPEKSKLFAAGAERLFNQDKFIYGMNLPPFGGDQFKTDILDESFAAQPISLVDVADNANLTEIGESISAILLDRKEGDVPYFYLLENESVAGERTMLVIRGKLFNGAEHIDDKILSDNVCDNGFTYYTIFIGAPYGLLEGGNTTPGLVFDNTVYRNTQYNYFVTLTGPGYNKVGDETAKLDVLCEVEPWKVADQVIRF